MKFIIKTLFAVCILLLCQAAACSQNPQHQLAVGTNAYLINTIAGGRYQAIYFPADLPGYVPGNIDTIYLRRNQTSANPITLPGFSIRLGYTSASTITTAGFLAPSSVVFSSPSVVIPPGNAGDWIPFPVPAGSEFFYDGSSSNIFLELRYGPASSNLQLRRQTNAATIAGYNTTDSSATAPATVSGNRLTLGFHVSQLTSSPPVVTATPASNVTSVSADFSGVIVYDGGAAITRRGFAWSLFPNPQLSDPLSDSIDLSLSGGASFDTTVTTLASGNKIYFRAFATNANGTGYSQPDSLYTLSTEPSAFPSGISATTACSQIHLAWDSIPGVSGYLIVFTPSPTLNQVPQDRTVYALNAPIGFGTVGAVNSGSTNNQATVSGLVQGNTYRFYIFPYRVNSTFPETMNYLTAPMPLPFPVVAAPLAPPLAGDTSVCPGDAIALTATSVSGTLAWYDAAGNLLDTGLTFHTGVINGDTLFHVVATNGICSSLPEIVNITLAPTPMAWAGNDTAICEGAMITIGMTAEAGVSYSWTSVSGTFSAAQSQVNIGPAATEIYILTAMTNASGCESSDSVLVLLHPAPAIPVISQSGNLLLSDIISGNQWFLGSTMIPAANGQSFAPSENGTYTVMHTDVNGCTSLSAPFTFAFTSVETFSGKSIRIFPNPFTDELNVSGISEGSIRVTDLAGKVMFDQKIGGMPLKIQGIPAGTYIATILLPNGHVSFPLIRQ